MNKYIYTDNKNSENPPVIVSADGILEADQKYKEISGLDPIKSVWIGCSIEIVKK